jgi:hypothetical protein
MSDKELIIRSLEKLNRRIRVNRLLRNLTFGLCLFLVVPLLFKILDLLSPFRGITVAVVLGLWFVALIAYCLWRVAERTPLADAASLFDSQALLHDEIKSAYWFVTSTNNSPRSADWVALQVHRAAQRASQVNVDRLCPRVIPSTSYFAAGLIAILLGLNFAPLPTNHNWMLLQGAPAFTLTPQEQKLINDTKKLLKQAEKAGQQDLAKQLEQIVQNLEQGNIDAAEAMKQLEGLKNALDEGNLDAANISEGLDEMAQDLSTSQETQDVSNAMAEHDFQKITDELQKLGNKDLKGDDAASKDALAKALQQAAENSHQSMQDVAEDMKQAADGLSKNDSQAFQDAMNQASKDMQALQQKVQDQQAKNDASRDIQDLKDSLQQRQQGNGQGQGQQAKGQQQAGKAQAAQAGKQGQKGPTENSDADPNGGNEGGTPTDNAAAGDENGQQGQGQRGEAGDPGGAGHGLNTSGNPNAPMNIMGAPTKLDVKLEMEKIKGENDGGTPQNLEEASKQERSKLDYRNVHSDLTPAQRDVLNQDKIPWEYRGFIKNYFQAIRPPRGNK